MEDIYENEEREKAIKHIEEIVNELSYIFDPSMNLKQYAKDIYDLLIYFGYNNYKINNLKCDNEIYRIIYDREIKYTKFVSEYNNIKVYVLNCIKHIYDENAIMDKKYSDIDYLYYDNPEYRNKMASIIIMQAIRLGYSFEDILHGKLNDEIYNTLYRDRVKNKSVSNKNDRIRALEALRSKPMSSEEIKAAIIAIIAFFAIVGISTKVYNDKKAAEENRNNRRNHKTTSVSHVPSHKNLVSQMESYDYDFENNEFIIKEGEDIAKL